ncbi:metallophosphoesterase family protein [Clostridium sp.]|uniref:metallophosphoesterase family protein n=1 Tax=Clostridium sp. TaxID=1506 RepID=UPI003F2F7D1B
MIERLSNETDFEYYKRIGLLKLQREIDLEWDELAIITQCDESGTHYRKKMYGVKETAEYYEEKIDKLVKAKTEEIEDMRLKEIEEKIFIMEKEKVKLRDQRNDLNLIKREIARIEHLEEMFKENIESLPSKEKLIHDEVLDRNDSSVTGACVISDIHVGCDVDNVLDRYNPNICKEKMNYYINKVIEHGKFHNIDKMFVLICGDEISGIIHETNRYASRMDIVEQVTYASELLSEAIDKLSDHFECEVGMVQGNHSRIVADKSKSVTSESFTLLINRFMKKRLKDNENVSFIENEDKDEEQLLFKIRNHTVFMAHGNQDGDGKLDRTIEMFKDKKIDFIIRGHFHSPSQFERNNTTIITNGCFAGEQYSKNARLYSPSVQKFLLFDDDGLRCSYDINLDKYTK